MKIKNFLVWFFLLNSDVVEKKSSLFQEENKIFYDETELQKKSIEQEAQNEETEEIENEEEDEEEETENEEEQSLKTLKKKIILKNFTLLDMLGLPFGITVKNPVFFEISEKPLNKKNTIKQFLFKVFFIVFLFPQAITFFSRFFFSIDFFFQFFINGKTHFVIITKGILWSLFLNSKNFFFTLYYHNLKKFSLWMILQTVAIISFVVKKNVDMSYESKYFFFFLVVTAPLFTFFYSRSLLKIIKLAELKNIPIFFKKKDLRILNAVLFVQYFGAFYLIFFFVLNFSKPVNKNNYNHEIFFELSFFSNIQNIEEPYYLFFLIFFLRAPTFFPWFFF